MADVPLGSAWVDVRLGFDKLNADMKSVGSKLAPLQSATTKGLKEQNALLDKQNKHVLDILGVTEKAAEADKARVVNMSFLDKTMSKMGANIGKGGMMGAQLSYAAQDFVTGLAMGNVNMAIMGASNNLGMMAMQISSAAAAWTTLGLVSIPLAITAFKAFGQQQDDTNEKLEIQKRKMDALAQAFENMAEVRGAMLGRFEGRNNRDIENIGNAGQAQNAIDAEEKGLRNATEKRRLLQEDIGKLNRVLLGEDVGPGTAIGKIGPDEMARRVGGPAARAGGGKLAEYTAIKDAVEKLPGVKVKSAEHSASELVKFGFTMVQNEDKLYQIRKDGDQLFVKRLSNADEAKKKQDEINKLTKEDADLQKEIEKSTSAIPKLKARRDQLAREDLEFAQRKQNAGFNKYELGKIDLDKQEKESNRSIMEKYKGVVLRPSLDVKDAAERIDDINKQYDADMTDAAKKRRAFSEEQGKIGRHISKSQEQEVRRDEDAAANRRQKAMDKLDKDIEHGPVMATDEFLKANKAEFAKKRLELAQQFAPQGQGHFTGIEQLAKDVQQGIGGPKGLDIAQQQLDTQKGSQQALHDILMAVQNLNLGVGP